MKQGTLFGGPPIRLLEDAKAEVEDGLDDGIVCPCCGQFAKVYQRKLNSSMARALIWLVRQHGDGPGWVNVPATAPEWLTRSRELPKLSYWQLIESKPNDKTATRCSGFWRPTTNGRLFAHSRTAVVSHVHLYNGAVVGSSDRLISIREALGERFDYGELMGHQRGSL